MPRCARSTVAYTGIACGYGISLHGEKFVRHAMSCQDIIRRFESCPKQFGSQAVKARPSGHFLRKANGSNSQKTSLRRNVIDHVFSAVNIAPCSARIPLAQPGSRKFRFRSVQAQSKTALYLSGRRLQPVQSGINRGKFEKHTSRDMVSCLRFASVIYFQ